MNNEAFKNNETNEKINTSDTTAKEMTDDTVLEAIPDTVSEAANDTVSQSSAAEASENSDAESLKESDEYSSETETDDFSYSETAEFSEKSDNGEHSYDEEYNSFGDPEASEEYNFFGSSDALEEYNASSSSKKSKKLIIRVFAGVAAVCVAGAAYCGAIVNGIGSRTVVRYPLEFEEGNAGITEKTAKIKYANPIMSAFETIALGKDGTTALTVNGQKISKGVLEFALNSAASSYVYTLNQNGEVSDFKGFNWNVKDNNTELTRAEYAKGYAVNMLVPIYALIAEGEKHGVAAITDEEEKSLNDWVENLKTQFGDDFETAMKESGYSDEKTLFEVQRMQMRMQKVYEDVEANTDKYVDEKAMASIADDDKITAKHILIMFADETDEAKTEAKKKAEEVLAKVKAGEDFDALIEEYNEDTGEPGSGYTFADDGTMTQAFADAAFKLEVGEVSELVETEFGYHIIKRVKRVPDMEEYLNMLTENADVRLNKSVYDKITVTLDAEKIIGEQ